MKRCSKCREVKPLNEFNNSKSSKQGVHHYCMICLRENKKLHYDYGKNKLQCIKTKYNLSESDLNEMYAAQGRKCKICKKEFNSVSKHGGLYIDHCHKSNKVRALLCFSCNRLLGVCGDNIVILRAAVRYLIKFAT